MLRKLIIFAIASGIAKKVFDAYRARPRTVAERADEVLSSSPSRLLGADLQKTTDAVLSS